MSVAMECEITSGGNLRLSAALADRYFPAGVCVASVVDADLLLLPLRSEANGGLVLKQRNTAGDRSLLISEVLGFNPPTGRFAVRWQEERGALVVGLGERLAEGSSGEPNVEDRSGGGLPPMGGVSPGDGRGRRDTAPAVGASQRTGSDVDRLGGPAGGEPAGVAAPGGGRVRAGVAP